VTSRFVGGDIAIGGETATASRQQFDFRFANYDFRALEIALLGAYQRNNAAIAMALFLLWLRRAWPGADSAGCAAAVRSGLREARWPGRLEAITPDPLTIVDVGHTPDAVKQSLASLTAIHGAEGWILVVGISSDKKADEIVGALAPSFDTIICTRAHHKGADPEGIASAVRQANPQADVRIAATVAEAVAMSQRLAVEQRRKIYVAGGLFLAIEYATIARGGRAEDLKFF
jgi:dihydrofolate synthase/folylpolyglutamate synthase